MNAHEVTLEHSDTLPLYQEPTGFDIEAGGHLLRFLTLGKDRLEALIQTIDAAQHSLKMCYYMFLPDVAGAAVRDALVRAAQRGVDVHLIIDAFGSGSTSAFMAPIVRSGGKVTSFSPRWNVRYLIRNHQKFTIADDRLVIAGGFNIADQYFVDAQQDGWADLGLVIEGKVAAQFVHWFDQLEQWLDDNSATFFSMRRIVREWSGGSDSVQLLLGGPTEITSPWARSVKRDIARSERLDLVMAYFSPPRSIRRLIGLLGQKGGAKLLLAGKSDNTTTIAASRALYGMLLEDGVEIREFSQSKLHMKLLVIDDVTYIGSANFDMRSIRLNLELMVRIKDAALAERMRKITNQIAEASTPVTNESYRKKASIFNRIRWRMAWFLVSVLDYTVARRLNVGP